MPQSKRPKRTTNEEQPNASAKDNQKMVAFDKIKQPNKRQLLCFGYLRQHFGNENINCNPLDFGSILYEYITPLFTFDYFSKRDKYHIIKNDCQIIECNSEGSCYCIGRCNYPMTPNSGIYIIDLEITNIVTKHKYNCMGITSDNDNYDGSLRSGKIGKNKNCHKRFWWEYVGIDYHIAWSSKVMNEKIITMVYDSDKYTMKMIEKSDEKYNHEIVKTTSIQSAKGKTFYWFIGHHTAPMSIAILN